MAVIITPANMEPAWPDAVKIAVRLAISLGLLLNFVNQNREVNQEDQLTTTIQ